MGYTHYKNYKKSGAFKRLRDRSFSFTAALVLAFTGMAGAAPLLFVQKAAAASSSFSGSDDAFSLTLSCDGESVVMDMSVDQNQPVSDWVSGALHYNTSYGNVYGHTLSNGDHDTAAVNTGTYVVGSDTASATVNGLYLKYGFLPTLYHETYSVNYSGINCDTTKPSVNVVSPVSGTASNGPFSVSGTATDDLSGLDRVDYTVTQIDSLGGSYVSSVDSGTASGTSNWSFGVSALGDGYYRLKVQAFDNAGNWKYDYNDVTVDNTKPSVNVVDPATANSRQGSFTVSGTASDPLSGIDYVNYTVTQIDSIGGSYVASIDSGTATGTTNWSFPVSGLSDGYYRLKVQVFDNAGNWKYDYNDVVVDNTKPSNSDTKITFPADEQLFDSGTFNITGEAVDSLSGIDPNNVLITVNQIDAIHGSHVPHSHTGFQNEQATYDPTTHQFSYNGVSGLADGYYRIQLKAYDLAGNVRHKHLDVEVDSTAPGQVSNLTHTTSGSDVTWSWDAATDPAPGSGVKGYLFDLTDGSGNHVTSFPTTTPDATLSKLVTGLSDGTYTFSVVTVDNADNKSAAVTDTVTIDTSSTGVGSGLPGGGSNGVQAGDGGAGGAGGAGANTFFTPQVLGAQTNTPSNQTDGDNDKDNNGQIKGDKTNKELVTPAKNTDSGFNWNWLWLLLLLLLVPVYYFARKRADGTNK